MWVAVWSYSHNFADYVGIVKSHVTRYQDDTCIIEFAERRLGIQFFKITKNFVSNVPETTLTRIIHFPDNDKITIVEY